MKKILLLILSVLLLSSCQSNNDNDVKLYNEMIDILTNTEEYFSSSKYFSISYELTDTTDGKRYYVVIDNPTMAMYGVNVIAFTENTDIENEFIPNAGIFEGKINLVPHQVNKDEGFVKGISISGLCTNDTQFIYCLVQWKDFNNTKTYRESLKIVIS